jgi:hypothetical protein
MAGEVNCIGNQALTPTASVSGQEDSFSTADGQVAQATGEVVPCPFASAATAAASLRTVAMPMRNAARLTSVRSPDGDEKQREQRAREAMTWCIRS